MTSTYRLQFHKDFNFEDFEKIIPYLKRLGVGTIYASPIFESVPGSTHGYDGINPCNLNPEIGTEQQLRAISKTLKADGLTWLQDIVPNHMAFHHHNPWLVDVLEKGRQSKFANFFDIDWNHKDFNGKLMLPFLGSGLKEVLNNNELTIAYQEGRLVLRYYDGFYPLTPKSYNTILSYPDTELQGLKQLLVQLGNMHQVEDASLYKRQWDEFLLQFASLMKNQEFSQLLEKAISEINAYPSKINEIVDQQVYHLSSWKDTNAKINFRRFFTVNGLLCLNIQNEEAFRSFHSYIKQLYDEGIFQGLRIDHIDGLQDPKAYLTRLREIVGEEGSILVEKILEPGEELPNDWPVQGTTGYDFLAMVNNLFTDSESEKEFTKFYRKLTGDKRSVQDQIREKKEHILVEHMAGELDNLYFLFLEQELANRPELSDNGDLKSAIGEFLIYCPIYRHYANQFPLTTKESEAIQKILNEIRSTKPNLDAAVGLLESAILIQPAKQDENYNSRALKFYQRCMQFTGPLMAKGVEDTLMYTYNRFIGHNEVGDSPESFGCSIEEFHQLMKVRQEKWPQSINATSTHDTKRGEDTRARLNVLTELGESWLETVEQWQMLNKDLTSRYQITANDEYFIYQTLIGVMPLTGAPEDDLENRIHEYLVKALREAKTNSDWAEPNEKYETAVKAFVSHLLSKDKAFYKILRKFSRKVERFGVLNSLSQVALKFTCPGVPDIYQGCETWDFSLVDPDNRRPVDYHLHSSHLDDIASLEAEGDVKRFLEDPQSGKIKLWLSHRLLNLRKDNKEVFAKGDYIPLKVKGKYKEHIIAFARRYQNQWIITIVPLKLLKLCKKQKSRLEDIKWKNTRVVLPANAPDVFESLLTKGIEQCIGSEIPVKVAFQNMPLSIWRMKQPENERGAGILLHITSLPSPFGIGDFGPGAKKFADYLVEAGQKYWQILPLGLTEQGQGYSPYSAISSMAGNTLLISPELLADEGFLDRSSLTQYFSKGGDQVDFSSASQIKEKLFDIAYHTFSTQGFDELRKDFEEFCETEKSWLDDFALYLVLKQQQGGKAWYEWTSAFKLRDAAALQDFSRVNAVALEKVKWLQFIFLKQWKQLKAYCNNAGIQLFGDLPFYVSNDSSDVWANKEIFCLDREGRMTGVAGVPPDYFNDNGQLWGMPVFKWDVLKKQNYGWWVNRIRKNMELYDLLRLDHFRAFSTYWDVPAGEETAKNGSWKPGPGEDFFKVLKEELGELPFVAEDLGDVDKAVYDLRDEFNLPGMRVVQFAFGEDMAQTVHSPHNFSANSVAYTGTHDNNTTRGWFREDSNELIRQHIKEYSRKAAKDNNIHITLSKLAYSSVAKIVILPMQDVIGLDERARMNTPASVEKNWGWRLKQKQMKKKFALRLRRWAEIYNRL